MALFKTSEKDVLKFLRNLSEEERAALLEKIGAADDEPEEETEVEEKTETEETVDDSAADGTDTAPEATAEVKEETVEETKTEDKPENGSETPAETQEEPPVSEPTHEEEPLTEAVQTPQEQSGISAEALQAIEAKYSAEIAKLQQQVDQLTAFIDTLKAKDEEEKEGIGFQRAQSSKTNANMTYAELRKQIVGI